MKYSSFNYPVTKKKIECLKLSKEFLQIARKISTKIKKFRCVPRIYIFTTETEFSTTLIEKRGYKTL